MAAANWIPLFLAALILLPPLPLPGGDTGPHPSVMLAGAGLMLGAARLDQWRIRLGWVELAFAGLAGALVMSLGFALAYSGTEAAAGSAARILLFGAGVYVYFAAVRGPDQSGVAASERITRWLFWIALAAAGFACVDFLFQLPTPARFEPQFLWLESGVYRRAQGLFYESSTLGNYCSFFIVFVAVSFASAKRLVPAWALAVGALVFSGALLLSFSRASVVACVISLGAVAVIEKRRWLKRGVVVALLAAAVIGFGMAVPEVAEGYWGRFLLGFERLLDSPDRALSGRIESWQTIAAFIGEHPVKTFFGIGYKTLPYTEYLGAPVIADNTYLSMLVETGVLGLTALVGLNVAILSVCWRAIRNGSLHGKWLFCFWAGEVVQMATGDILTYWRVLPLYFWVLAQAVRDADTADRSIR